MSSNFDNKILKNFNFIKTNYDIIFALEEKKDDKISYGFSQPKPSSFYNSSLSRQSNSVGCETIENNINLNETNFQNISEEKSSEQKKGKQKRKSMSKKKYFAIKTSGDYKIVTEF